LSATLRCRIVFIEVGPGRVLLDVLATPEGLPGAGTPLSVDADLPWSKTALVALATLQRWTAEGRDVVLEFRQGDRARQVRASSGPTWMLLDLRTDVAA